MIALLTEVVQAAVVGSEPSAQADGTNPESKSAIGKQMLDEARQPAARSRRRF